MAMGAPKQIYVIHENDVWVEPLRVAFAEQSLPFAEWFLAEGTLDLAATPPDGIFYNRMSASSHTRDHRYAAELTGGVLAWLERHGRRVINNSRALALEISKIAQYAELARRKRGLTNETKINEFAVKQVRQLLTQFPNAEELERSVFFTVDPYKASQRSDASDRAKYTGCAFCHEVKQAAGVSYPTAEITKPVMIERWLPHAHFSHAKHAIVANCRECHVAAVASRLTSDVLIPTKETCVRCHRPSGVARKASECSTCHLYHSPDQPNTPATRASTISLKQMLLGTSRSGVRGTSP